MKKKQQGLLSQRLQNEPAPQQKQQTTVSNEPIVINLDDADKKAKPPKKAKKNKPEQPQIKPEQQSPLSGKFKGIAPKEYSQYKEPEETEPVELDMDKVAEEIKQRSATVPEMEHTTIKEKPRPKVVLKKIFTKKHILIAIAACFVLFLAIEHIPSLIYNVLPDSATASDHAELTLEENSQSVLSSILESLPEEDFDSDKIVNSQDEAPYDPDADRNGIIDGDVTSSPISSQTKVSYDNIEFTVSNNLAGCAAFKDGYAFSGYEGWVRITEQVGHPYIYHNSKWKEAEVRQNEDMLLVYIPGDCLLQFLDDAAAPTTVVTLFGHSFAYASEESDTVTNVGFAKYIFDVFFSIFLPQENGSGWGIGTVQQTTDYHYALSQTDITAPAVLATYDMNSTDRYTSYDNAVSVLENVYAMINNDHNVLCSLQTEDGEYLGIVYGYDYLGNLYVADYQTGELAGIINITPKAQIISSGDEYMQRNWYEFDGLGGSSVNGDRLVFIFPE